MASSERQEKNFEGRKECQEARRRHSRKRRKLKHNHGGERGFKEQRSFSSTWNTEKEEEAGAGENLVWVMKSPECCWDCGAL